MNSHWKERSARDYEREAQATRHRLAQDLDELNDRLTVGQIFDEILSYARGGSGTFVRALSNAARENPVPTMLIGAGCMLLLSEKMGFNRGVKGAIGEASWLGSATADSMLGAGSAAAGAASRGVDRASAQARAAADIARSGVREATAAAREQTTRATEQLKEGAASVRASMSDASQRAQQAMHGAREQAAQ